jgi:hypothetical protein
MRKHVHSGETSQADHKSCDKRFHIYWPND